MTEVQSTALRYNYIRDKSNRQLLFRAYMYIWRTVSKRLATWYLLTARDHWHCKVCTSVRFRCLETGWRDRKAAWRDVLQYVRFRTIHIQRAGRTATIQMGWITTSSSRTSRLSWRSRRTWWRTSPFPDTCQMVLWRCANRIQRKSWRWRSTPCGATESERDVINTQRDALGLVRAVVSFFVFFLFHVCLLCFVAYCFWDAE